MDKGKEVHFLHHGAVHALQTRGKQAYNLVYVLKQHIHVLRQAAQELAYGHREAATHLNPILTASSIEDVDADTPSPLLARQGFRTTIEGLKLHHIETADRISESYNPRKAFSQTIL